MEFETGFIVTAVTVQSVGLIAEFKSAVFTANQSRISENQHSAE